MRKSRFDANEFLNEKYIKGKFAIIPIQVNSKDEFFDKHDPNRNTLSHDLANYIDACAYNIPIKYRLILDIKCPNLDDKGKKEIERLIRIHYGLIIHDKNLDLKINQFDVTWLFILGVVVLALAYLWSDNLQSFMTEILLIAGWFAIWESVDDFVIGRRKIRIDKRNNKQLFDATVQFSMEKEKELVS